MTAKNWWSLTSGTAQRIAPLQQPQVSAENMKVADVGKMFFLTIQNASASQQIQSAVVEVIIVFSYDGTSLALHVSKLSESVIYQ